MEGNKNRDNKVLDSFLFDRGGKAKRYKITSTDLLVPILPIIHSAVNFVTVNFLSAEERNRFIVARDRLSEAL